MNTKHLEITDHIYFGTYKLTNEETLLNSLENVYKYGYTKIDTATLYKNQHIIGQFLNTPDIKDNIILTETKKETQLDLKHYLTKRDKFWITSKVSFRVMPKGESEIRKSIDKTLSDLQTHYIDLMILYIPCHNVISLWTMYYH